MEHEHDYTRFEAHCRYDLMRWCKECGHEQWIGQGIVAWLGLLAITEAMNRTSVRPVHGKEAEGEK